MEENKEFNIELLRGARDNHHVIVRLLLENGAEVNTHRGDGVTPLLLASREGHHHIAKLLLCHGADVNKRTRNGWSALLIAVKNGHSTIVRLLLEYGADVNAKGVSDNTALIYASGKDCYMVKELLGKGADVNAKNEGGETALHVAVMYGIIKIVQELVNNVNIDVNMKDGHGHTGLSTANVIKDKGIIELLKKHGAMG